MPPRAPDGGGDSRAWEGVAPARGRLSMDMPPLLTLEEVAAHLRLNTRTIRRLVASGRLPCARIAGRLRFVPADVVRFVQARRG